MSMIPFWASIMVSLLNMERNTGECCPRMQRCALICFAPTCKLHSCRGSSQRNDGCEYTATKNEYVLNALEIYDGKAELVL